MEKYRHSLKLTNSLRNNIDDILNRKIDEPYRTFYITKKNGKKRRIDAPCEELKKVQRYLLDTLQKPRCRVLMSKATSYGFVKGRCNIDSALAHRRLGIDKRAKKGVVTHNKHRFISEKYSDYSNLADFNDKNGALLLRGLFTPKTSITIDIKNAFNSITYDMLEEGLELLYEFETIKDRTRILNLVLKDGVLPQGAPTSPLMMNIALHKFDIDTIRLITQKSGAIDIRYTRYADDICISTSDYKAKSIIPFVYNSLEDHGLTPNRRKTRIMTHRTGIFVNGINIINNATHISTSRKYRNNIRAAINNASFLDPNSIRFEQEVERIKGKIAYIFKLDKQHGTKLLKYAIDKNVLSINNAIIGKTLKQHLIDLDVNIKNRKKLYTK